MAATSSSTNTNTVSNSYEDRDRITTKPPIFYGENIYYWKDRIESFFLGYDADLWDLVIDGYSHPTNSEGKKVERKSMTEVQKNEFKNHHEARTIMLNAISHTKYEKITNRDTTHDMFESLKMTHEGNLQVKETKALALM